MALSAECHSRVQSPPLRARVAFEACRGKCDADRIDKPTQQKRAARAPAYRRAPRHLQRTGQTMAKMPLTELKTLLEAERNDALAAISASKLSAERSDAMDYYLGDMAKDMPVQEGRSQAVSTDVADTVEGIMPSLMEIFCSGDEIVKFAPVGPNDSAAAG